ncbi:MAG: two-component system, OmpR family, alkaline phosphatase synthesis response regulator PhoP [Humisphaera sp.]|nr:two-component system, OmpR family, alkaline phosphatase synthesis response regulator PhoP [Humisphaera sp.]
MSRCTVLVIDDEKDLLELVRYNLEKEHLDVITASDGQSGLEIGLRHKPDLVLLDLMMPGMNGLEVCKQLRSDPRTKRVPIIMLTAKAAETDKIVGLEMGADDYIVKPFSVRELLARVRAVLRRTNADVEGEDVIRRGSLTVDVARHEVTWDSQPVSLTATEFRILEFLVNRPNRVNSRDEIINGALDRDESIYDRTIDVHITALRKKLGVGSKHILTVRGFGYKWSDTGEV